MTVTLMTRLVTAAVVAVSASVLSAQAPPADGDDKALLLVVAQRRCGDA